MSAHCPQCRQKIDFFNFLVGSFSLRRWSLFYSHCPKCKALVVNKTALLLSYGVGILAAGLVEIGILLYFVRVQGITDIPVIYPILGAFVAVFVTLTTYSFLFVRFGTVEKR